MTEELKPCPFCGSEAEYVGSEGMGYRVQCRRCNARGPWGDYGYQALSAWNTRAPFAGIPDPAAFMQAARGMKEALERIAKHADGYASDHISCYQCVEVQEWAHAALVAIVERLK